MAFKALFPNGLGESSADSLVVNAPFYTTGNVWYVNATTGTDAGTSAGQNRMKPLATIGQAYTNAADGDVIVLMDGHTQTLTAALTIAKRVLIVGGGESDGKPTVKLTLNAAAASLFNVTAAGVEIRNVWFEENAQTNASAKVLVAGNRFRMKGCYFQCGATDTGSAVNIGAVTTAEFDSTTFVSTATLTSAQPLRAVLMSDASAVDVRFDSCVFDGGTVGFSGYWAVSADSVAVTALVFENCSLLRGADILANTGAVGWVGGISTTESALVNWNENGGE